jgi:uncharacterized protein YutE (UPF0331/DUF86 family)
MSSQEIIIRAIFTSARGLKHSLKEVKELMLKLLEDVTDATLPKKMYIIESVGRMLKDYNDLRNQILHVLGDPKLYNMIPYVSEDIGYSFLTISSVIDSAIRGCSIIMSACKPLMKPKIPAESLDRLNQLRVEVEKIESDLQEERRFLVVNIGKAIQEYEQGHFLASALISSRVITYVFEQIPTYEGEQRSSDLAKLKVETLVRRGIIDEDRKDEQESFLRASKQARNLLSHKAYIFPEIEEALALIASAITFCKYFIRLTEHSY